MNTKEIRERFQQFMKERGYVVEEPQKLISEAFPTTFTMSGGVPEAQKALRGEMEGNKQVIQPCYRYFDLGLEDAHLPFFKMCIIYSINGFERKKLFGDFFEFLVDIGLSPERMKVTVFGGGQVKGHLFSADEDALSFFAGMKIEIVEGEEEEAAFVANKMEPVGGPRVEIYYKQRNGEYLEVWTSVMYNHTVEEKDGVFLIRPFMEPKIYAAGFGLERLAMVLNEYEDIMQVDTLDALYRVTSKYMDDGAAKHAAKDFLAIAFLITDGATREGLRGRRHNQRKGHLRKLYKHFFSQSKKDFYGEMLEVLRAQYEEVCFSEELVRNELVYRLNLLER